MPETNKEIMSRFIVEAWQTHNHAICDELLAPDYRHYMPGSSEPTIGIEPYKRLIDVFMSGFPDIRLEIDQIFREADHVCVQWTAHGTHLGEFNGIAATGRRVTLPGVGVARISGGKIHEVQSIFDRLGLMQQLGA